MNGAWGWILVLLVVCVTLALIFLILSLFSKKSPLESITNSLIALMAAVVAANGAPEIQGEANFWIDWGSLLKVDGVATQVTTQGAAADTTLAMACLAVLLLVCLVRLPATPE